MKGFMVNTRILYEDDDHRELVEFYMEDGIDLVKFVDEESDGDGGWWRSSTYTLTSEIITKVANILHGQETE